jgi:hypothetical protein
MMLHLALYLKNLDGIIYLYTNRKMQKAILMYKVTNNLTPMYLQDLFVTRVSHYSLRDSEGKLFLPKPIERIILSAPLVIVELHYGIACLNL